MVDFCVSCKFDQSLLEEFRESLDDLVLLLGLLVADLVDVVLKEEHLDVAWLGGVPLVGCQHGIKLLEGDITAHPNALLLD